MKKKLRKLLKLFVMTQIKHDEEYYKTALSRNGVNLSNLTHGQIAAFKCAMKATEADLMIEFAFTTDIAKVSDLDCSHLIKKP